MVIIPETVKLRDVLYIKKICPYKLTLTQALKIVRASNKHFNKG